MDIEKPKTAGGQPEELATQALQASEARYRTLFDHASDFIMLLELGPEGVPVIQEANDAALRAHGYSLEELRGKPIYFLDAEQSASLVAERGGYIQAAAGAVFTTRHRRKDGSVFDVEVSVKPLMAGGKSLLLDISRDITARRRTEAVLAESEEKYRSLFESSRDALMTLAPPSWRFTSGNPATLTLFGAKSVEEFDVCTPGDLSPERQPDGRLSAEKAGEMIAAAMRAGSNSFEWMHKRLDGGEFLAAVMLNRIELEGRMFLQATVRDITERKAAEAELQANKVRLSSALEMARLGHWEYDVASDLFTFNDQFYSIFRTTVEKIGGYTMHSAEYAQRFVHPDDVAMVGEEIRKAIETADPHFSRQIEHRMFYADGMAGYIAVRFFIVKDSRGRTVKTYGVNQDITERKQAEEAVREAFEMANVLNSMLQHSLGDAPLREKLGDHLADLFRQPWLAVQNKGAVFIMNPRGNALQLAAQRGLV